MATNIPLNLETSLVVNLEAHYGLIAVSGVDAAQFLQGQLTCDIREVTPEKSQFSAYCNLKGRVRALFYIFIRNNTYYLLLAKTILPNIVTQLKKYALFSKVNVNDVSQDWKCFGISGHLPVTDIAIPDTFITLTVPHSKQHSPYPCHLRHILIIHNTHTEHTYLNTLMKHYCMADFETWKLLDIRAGIPHIWPETVELFLPHDLNLPVLGAISFTKGCYCGQEIIARMEYRAKLKRHLYRAKLMTDFTTPTLPGTKLCTEHSIDVDAGTIVTAATYENTTEMLIETLDEYVQNGTPLYTNTSAKLHLQILAENS